MVDMSNGVHDHRRMDARISRVVRGLRDKYDLRVPTGSAFELSCLVRGSQGISSGKKPGAWHRIQLVVLYDNVISPYIEQDGNTTWHLPRMPKAMSLQTGLRSDDGGWKPSSPLFHRHAI